MNIKSLLANIAAEATLLLFQNVVSVVFLCVKHIKCYPKYWEANVETNSVKSLLIGAGGD